MIKFKKELRVEEEFQLTENKKQTRRRSPEAGQGSGLLSG